MTPWASRHAALDWVDALFTATSAVCVTGLTVVDTGSHFSGFGQGVILALIQTGGLGIVTLSAFVFYLLTGRMPIRDREALLGTVAGTRTVSLTALLKAILLSAVVLELAGAIVLALCFWEAHTPWQAIYLGVFHSVSAFCNAGFSLFRDSLVGYRSDLLVNVAVMALIVTGGLGFPVLMEIGRAARQRRRTARLSLHSKVVLTTSGILLASGVLVFYGVEHANSLQDLPLGTQVLTALFQSVTARTAGFNTVEFHVLANTSLFAFIVLMFIGGGSGSCAGGIKVNSFTVLAGMAWGRLNGRSDVHLYGRRVPEATVDRAVSVAGFSLLLVFAILMLLLVTELGDRSHEASRGTFLELAFEATSAFGTVGLSMGVTPHLSTTGRLLVTVLMFVGRIGPLTMASMLAARKPYGFRYAQEDVLVG